MLFASLLAFLHHVAAFALVAVLTVQLVLIRQELTAGTARRLQIFDAVYGASAGIVLVAGLLRVFYFEKGASYYFHSLPFIAKLSLFVAVGLLSIYPTVQFRSWKKAFNGGSGGNVPPGTVNVVRKIIHWQLAGVLLILLCAALMARGIGSFA